MPIWLLFLTAVGATFIAIRGDGPFRVLARLRELKPGFFGCPKCLGTWVGMGSYLLETRELSPLGAFHAVWFGAAVGMTAYLAVLLGFKLDE